ncbi:MAG: PfaD family polyunsaturated fatty acid/polyketide biosynthesis protein [Candidatus Hydrogenedentes bacterium]|nr:PfaD family polyunsaturated fatty acid/polyketide biosynthesis protein [Candidatus Hydrogenedentota bacterium]
MNSERATHENVYPAEPIVQADGAGLHPHNSGVLGRWISNDSLPTTDPERIGRYISDIATPIYVVRDEGQPALATGGVAVFGEPATGADFPLIDLISPCTPATSGDPAFCAAYGIQYPYLAGAMANGIASETFVEAMSRGGMLAFFGAAGLSHARIEAAIDRLSTSLGDAPYGFNLIHSPNEADHEAAVVDLYLRRGITLVEASAYLGLTLPLVRYRVHGIHRDASGRVVAPNRVIAKVSRIEIASKFFGPPPEKLLAKLVESGDLNADQAEMARTIPMAQDITAEADSGGHTDHRPAISLLPTLLALRDRMQDEYGYDLNLRVGLAGGIATPASAAAAFAMGAAYVLTGSINQACVESGTSDTVREMLAGTQQADVARAPAADMFEMGVTVQVLKRGTMFPMRATKLHELYRNCASLEDIPTDEREKLEKSVFRASLDEVWTQTRAYFMEHDPRQVERAERDPRHKMALVFRSYLGQSSNWANSGVPDRKMDYQVWCGPAMGAFNEWVKGSYLEASEHREVVTVALNILYGTAVLQRCAQVRRYGIAVSGATTSCTPMPREAVEARLAT